MEESKIMNYFSYYLIAFFLGWFGGWILLNNIYKKIFNDMEDSHSKAIKLVAEEFERILVRYSQSNRDENNNDS